MLQQIVKSQKKFLKEAELQDFPDDFFKFFVMKHPSLVRVVTLGPNIVGSMIGYKIGTDGFICMFSIDQPHRG